MPNQFVHDSCVYFTLFSIKESKSLYLIKKMLHAVISIKHLLVIAQNSCTLPSIEDCILNISIQTAVTICVASLLRCSVHMEFNTVLFRRLT